MTFRRFDFNHPNLKERRKFLRRAQTEAEKVLWRRIRNKQLGPRFWRQYSVGPFVLDFYCPSKRLAIELDGGQHTKTENITYDQDRSNYLREYNIKVIRFWNNDVLKNMEGVLERICEVAELSISPPNLPLN